LQFCHQARGIQKRTFGIIKADILVLTHPINLHHHNDTYYLILANILVRVEDGEQQIESMHNVLDNAAWKPM